MFKTVTYNNMSKSNHIYVFTITYICQNLTINMSKIVTSKILLKL